nr:polysaccharide deacetylase family protein [Novosphingobium rosa]
MGQRFLLTVDTEEEFDWTQPLRASGHTVDTVGWITKFQEFCGGFGVVPVYLIDYPIATSPLAAEVLREPLAQGKAEVGVQLHPWVNPPHEEEVNQHNSFAGNLPYELERAKFMHLHETIQRNFGVKPLIYRAGRYGTGPNTAAILQEAGIAIDTSVRSRFDYSPGGGPDYSHLGLRPWWVDEARTLMELPLTSVFAGGMRRWGQSLFPAVSRMGRMQGLMARLRLLDRIPLTPEGVTIAEALRAVDLAVAAKLPVVVLSFHSPSLSPGYTPYVRTAGDLDRMYDWWRAVFTRLIAARVKPTSVKEIMESVVLA